MSKESGTTDLWRSGTREGQLIAMETHQTGLRDVGGDSHSVTF